MTEPTSARYIYIDPNNLVHVLLPVVSGTEIGLDNTCKAVYAPQEFFGKSQDAKAVSALTSLKSYQEALECDIELLQEDSPLKQQKIERLKQVKLYINFFETQQRHPLFNSLSLALPEYPSPLKRLMAEPNCNLYSMVLRPVVQDAYLRTVNPVFSLKHRKIAGGKIIEADSPFADTLLRSFQHTPIHRKDARARVIAAVMTAEEKGSDFNFDRLRERLHTEMSRSFDEPIRLTTRGEQGQDVDITQATIDAWMGEYNPQTKEEYLEALLNYAAPNFFDNRESPFDSIQTGEGVHATEESAAQLSLVTQFFLGEANIYCVAKGRTKANFGELLDSNEELGEELAATIRSVVLSQGSIEAALFDFINNHSGKFGLDALLTEDDKKQINNTFRAHYTQVKEAPYFDEFMVVDTEKNGLFVTHQGNICTDLTEFIKAAVDEDLSLQNWNHYYFQRVREDFKRIHGALPPQNTLYADMDAEAEARFDIELDALSNEQLRALIERLPLEEQNKIKSHPDVQARILLPDFLLHVARGEQNQADRLLTSLSEKGEDIQALLLKQGQFTDYSGRTFHCSAFEYAYWAKDIYMCRMLEKHMDERTKVEMARLCETMDREGLEYTLEGAPFKNAHFDFTPLKEAYRTYLAEYLKPQPKNWAVIERAWFNVGAQQRLVPVHVANEYCHLTRSFHPTPSFLDESLQRSLQFYNSHTYNHEPWFPLGGSGTGLGFDFVLMRRCMRVADGLGGRGRYGTPGLLAKPDLDAVSGLDKVRSRQLTELYIQLSQALDVGPSP